MTRVAARVAFAKTGRIAVADGKASIEILLVREVSDEVPGRARAEFPAGFDR
jgi:hypothetical protein